MSNASKTGNLRHSRCLMNVLPALLCVALISLSAPAHAQAAPNYSDLPDPSISPMAGNDSPDSYVGEGVALKPEQVIRMLQEGNSGKPLTIAQLAAINDAMKRMEYLAEMRRKLNDAQGGGSSFAGNAGGSGVTPGMTSPAPMAASSLMGGVPMVIRISGSGGRLQALVVNGGQQMLVREGDMIGNTKVTSIRLTGVRVSDDTGSSSLLPFATPYGAGIISSSR